MTTGTTSASPLDPTISARHADFVAQRPPGAEEDVHMLAGVVDHVIERCSSPGDTVLDPFAGFGTTLDRAARLGRHAIGVELLPERVAYVQRRVPSAEVHEGDAREVIHVLTQAEPQAPLPAIDLIVSSPPYMTENLHDADPLTAYERDGGDYRRYLDELGLVAAQCAQLLKPGGYLVWNVADIHHAGVTTRLITDCARVLAGHLTACTPTNIVWDTLPHDLIADALLVFRRTSPLRAQA